MKRFQIVILTIMLASLSACATNSLPSSSTESSVSISVSNPQDFLSELEDMETGQILEELKISDGGCQGYMNGFATLDIPPCRRYIVIKATAGFAVCRPILKLLLFYSCLDFTQNLGETRINTPD